MFGDQEDLEVNTKLKDKLELKKIPTKLVKYSQKRGYGS